MISNKTLGWTLGAIVLVSLWFTPITWSQNASSPGGDTIGTSILAILTDVWDDTNNALGVTLRTLLSGEDQTNNLLMTSGGIVRLTTLMSGVSTNTTSSLVDGYTGSKTVKGTLTCNAGGSTNCGVTVTIFGNEENTTNGSEQLCQVVVPTGAAYTPVTCPVITAAFRYLYATTTGIAGTSPSLTLKIGL